MLLPFDNQELNTRIELNFRRLLDGDYYHIDQVFSPVDYDWYGDKEGRALLAFCSHYKISGKKILCMDQMMAKMGDYLNEDGFFGPNFLPKIHEQQLSGHSWLLRGLCEYHGIFGDAASLKMLKNITENLFLPLKGRFVTYPVERDGKNDGGVSGSQGQTISDWILSTDIGCAFMSIDGLSHVYAITKDERIRELLDEMIGVYLEIDKVCLQAQTHCTLTAARGMMRMYWETSNADYLQGAASILELYANGGGMTATYQNLNWWGRPETWTEPCAIVDSFMVAGELYKATKKEEYLRLAARIYHNGLATAQRGNGGAGTDSVVLYGVQDSLFLLMYEAHFCCTMRLAEGLWYVHENRALFRAEVNGTVVKQGHIYADGDLLYGEVTGPAKAFVQKTVVIDGHELSPLVKYYRIPDEALESSKQKILF